MIRGIGRDLLSRFLYGFSDELAANHIEIPGSQLGDTEFFTKIGDLFSGSVSLPAALTSTLTAIALMVASSGSSPLQAHHHRPPPPRYSIARGRGLWRVTFGGQPAEVLHERGVFYVAWLLLNPPEHPIHAVDLVAKIPDFYRKQLGLSSLVDPSTGKTITVQSHARLQERSLALDDAQAMRGLFRKEKELEDILDSDAIEAVKAEATRELEEIEQAIRHYNSRTKDSATQAANTVRKAIARLHKHLCAANDVNGNPHPVLRPFADHIQTHIIIPSARYSGHGGPHSKAGFPGCFTYESPPGVRWLG